MILRLLLASLIAFDAVAAAATDGKLGFNRDIRPILSDKCFACHGSDAKKRKAGRRLDTPEGAFAVSDDVQAIKPGDLSKSDAWRRITNTDEDEVMPPPDSHKKLSNEEKALIKRWIEEGAPYQKHWAFEPQVKVATPQVEIPGAPAGSRPNPIDAFIVDRLHREGLALSPQADRETLIRRVAFAVTGLPPGLKEVDEFLGDSSPDAYEKMLDRYLASPRYGEEMARHWLDVARYGDTHGLHLDNERQMWAYRDWVIRAFNQNLPFDQFTIWQLAGDLLPDPTIEQMTATGFNRCNVTTGEGGAIDEEFIFRYAVDRTSTMSATWMGLTAGCAVCHDHKYDPLSTKEFYSLYSFFHSNADPAMDGNALLTKPTLKVPTPEQDKNLKELQAKLADLQKQTEAKLAAIQYTDPATAKSATAPKETETVWVEDDFPAGAKTETNAGTHPLTWVTAEKGPVFSGARSLKRGGSGLAQDFYNAGAAPLEVPVDARFFLHVYLDPADPPEAVMLQLHQSDWEHRAVWGNQELFTWGKPNSTERFGAGPLPAASKWVRLEVEAGDIGLKAGDKITGIAFTVHGGTAYFDHMGVISRDDLAVEPAQSFVAWQKGKAGKDTPGVPPEINKLLKDGPEKARQPEQEKQLRNYYLQFVCAQTKGDFAKLLRERDEAKAKQDAFNKAIPSTFVWKDLEKPRESFVMMRGQYDKPGDKVEPATPAIFQPLAKAKANERATRLDLANWLVSPSHPLTARVTVNRFWQQFFGTGLVKTSFDFGTQGSLPSHPELLDWLAVTYRESGWDTRKLVRLMLTSATFRQSSAGRPELWQRDPENRLHARGPRFRLDAEQLRDNVLFTSGLINLETGGKGVKPYQPPNIWEPVGFGSSNTRVYMQDAGSALYRRSIYVFLKRTAPPPFMSNFDAPNREQTCTVRERSNTPLQALQLMNEVQHFEAARALAERLMSEGGTTSAERIIFAYRIVLARKPAEEEIAVVQDALGKYLARVQQDPASAKKTIFNGESKPKAGPPDPELAAWTLVANLILNLDETVTLN